MEADYDYEIEFWDWTADENHRHSEVKLRGKRNLAEYLKKWAKSIRTTGRVSSD